MILSILARRMALVIGVMFIGLVAVGHSQTPSVVVLSPADSSIDVPVNSNALLKTNFRIDSTRLRMVMDDSMSAAGIRPTLVLVPKLVHTILPDSLLTHGFGGALILTNDTTLTYVMPTLAYGSTYVLKVTNLWVITGSGDTVLVPSETIEFTTALPPHQLVATSINGNQEVGCADTIEFYFNRRIDSLDADEVVSLYTHIPFDTTGTEVPMMATIWFNEDSTVIYATSTAWIAGQHLRAYVDLEQITGDSADNRNYYFGTATRYPVTFEAGSSNVSIPLVGQPDVGALEGWEVFPLNDSVTVAAEARLGHHVFSHWYAPQVPSLHMDSNASAKAYLGCGSWKEGVTIKAVYRPLDFDTVEVAGGSNGVVRVYDADGDYLGGSGNYVLYEGEHLDVVALANSGARINAWTVMDTNSAWKTSFVGGNTANGPQMSLTLKSGISSFVRTGPLINVGFTTATANTFGTSGGVYFEEEYGTAHTSIAMFAPGGANCTNGTWESTCTEPAAGVTNSYSVAVLDPCFEIYKIVKTYRNTTTNAMVVDLSVITTPTNNYTVNLLTDSPYESVRFFVRRKRYRVEIERFMDNGDESPLNQGRRGEIVDIKAIGTVPQGSLEGLPGYLNTLSVSGEENPVPGKPENLNLIDIATTDDETSRYYVLCGTQIEVKGFVEDWATGEFDSWHSGPGYASSGDNPFTLTVNTHKLLRAVFEETFEIDSIGYYQGSTSQITWQKPDSWVTPDDVRILPSGTTDIIVRFSESVNLSTVTGATILGVDEDERIDFSVTPDRQIYANAGITWAPYNGNADAQMTFSVQNAAGKKVPKMQTLIFAIDPLGTALESTTGATLENYGAFRLRTEMPTVRVTYKEIEISEETDGDDGLFSDGAEVYNLWSVIYATPGGVDNDAGQLPPADGGEDPNDDDLVGIWKMDEGYIHVFDAPLFLSERLIPEGVIRLDIETWERDDRDLFDRLPIFFDSLGAMAGRIADDINVQVDTTDTTGTSGQTANTIRTILRGVEFGAPVIARVMEVIGFSSSDQPLGNRRWIYGMPHWWGARPNLDHVRVNAGDCFYTVEFKLE